MAEINALPWNGLTVISTFAGAGGSSLGYRMAGFKVMAACEFVPHAVECYRLNARPETVMLAEDLRTLKGEAICTAAGIAVGSLDVLDGSPPCQPFSTAGRREATWGKVRQYGDHVQRADDLFFEFIRLVREMKPKVFVAENVSGLVKGTAKGYFKEILAAMKAAGYRVKASVLDAQWLGVPQMRQRVIFMGVREDLKTEPAFPKPLPYRYSLREALPGLLSVSAQPHGPNSWAADALQSERPAPTVPTGPDNGTYYHHEVERITIEGANGFNRHAGYGIEQPMATVQAGRPGRVASAATRVIHDTGGWCVDHDVTDQPCPTVVATPKSLTHYQVEEHQLLPPERRKFTIDELKAVCSFPPDFQMTGSYAEQWARLGNAVPPLMMQAIAVCIEQEVLART